MLPKSWCMAQLLCISCPRSPPLWRQVCCCLHASSGWASLWPARPLPQLWWPQLTKALFLTGIGWRISTGQRGGGQFNQTRIDYDFTGSRNIYSLCWIPYLFLFFTGKWRNMVAFKVSWVDFWPEIWIPAGKGSSQSSYLSALCCRGL